MLMEEETTCSSPLRDTGSLLLQPQIVTWTSVDHHYVNGEQEVVRGKTEAETILEHGMDELNLSSKTGRETPEEAGQRCELMIWPVCPSSQLSSATVQWDTPAPFSEKLMMDRRLANEQSCGDVTSAGSTSPLLCEIDDGSAELSAEEREERDGFDSRPLSSHVEWRGNGSEPCDAASVQDQARQETGYSTLELVDETPLRTGSEDEEGLPLTVETVYLIDTDEEAEGSEGEGKSFVDVKVEEEQEEPAIPLTAQGEEEQLSGIAIEDENKEGDEEEEQQLVITVFFTASREKAEVVRCPSDVDVPAEPHRSDDTVLTVNSHKLIDQHQSEGWDESQHSGCEEDEDEEIQEPVHEELTEETEMCPNVDDDMETEAVGGNEEEESEKAERIENLPEMSELDDDCDETTSSTSPQPEQSESEQPETSDDPQVTQAEEMPVMEEEQLVNQRLEESPEMELSQQADSAEHTGECTQSDQPVCIEDPEMAEQHPRTDPEPNERSPRTLSEELAQSENSEESETASEGAEATQPTAEPKQAGSEAPDQVEESRGPEDGGERTLTANGEQRELPESNLPQANGGEVEREMACRLAQRLFKLDEIQRVDVVKHLDKDNDFSRAVGEEYLKFFDFSGQTLDHALRSFLKVVVLIGESQERERVLQHFACRFHQCNPDAFSSSGSVLALTCALMLLNTDLHGQHVGKSMSSSKFVSNLEGMNEDENFSKDLLKSLYNSIKSEPLEWAVDEEELKTSVLVEEDAGDEALRSKSNPFQVVAHDKKALVVKEGFLQRKLHANTDGKRTPWGKRGWKTFYGVLRGMVLFLQKDDYRKEHQTSEEVVSVHHSVAQPASDYTKKPHVFRLQTADWRVFLFQASSKVEMNSWIGRFNLVSALHSSPPFPAAVGSQRKFFRPILPASQSAHTLERQLQSHVGMLESFKADLSYLQQNPPEGRKARAKELEENRVRAEYLQHEIFRFEIYIQAMDGWMKVKRTSSMRAADLHLFDKAVCTEEDEEEEEGELKKSHSSPSLELEIAAPAVVKVRRNISERRTYRRTIIPRWNKET